MTFFASRSCYLSRVTSVHQGDVITIPNGVPHWFKHVDAPLLFHTLQSLEPLTVEAGLRPSDPEPPIGLDASAKLVHKAEDSFADFKQLLARVGHGRLRQKLLRRGGFQSRLGLV